MDKLIKYIKNDDIIALKTFTLGKMNKYRIGLFIRICMDHNARRSLAYIVTFWDVYDGHPLYIALHRDNYKDYLNILLKQIDINAITSIFSRNTLIHDTINNLIIEKMNFVLALPNLDLYMRDGSGCLPIDNLDKAIQRHKKSRIYEKLRIFRDMVVSMMDEQTYVLEIV